MASDGVPITIPATRLVHGSQAPTRALGLQSSGGKPLPLPGQTVAAQPSAGAPAVGHPAAKPPAERDLHALVEQLNRQLANSGRPNQFRLNSSAGRKVIQEINPDTGAIVGEYSEALFPTLAQSLGISGVLINSRA
jgi:uncharacterized FlaG/YvyC family protein